MVNVQSPASYLSISSALPDEVEGLTLTSTVIQDFQNTFPITHVYADPSNLFFIRSVSTCTLSIAQCEARWYSIPVTFVF